MNSILKKPSAWVPIALSAAMLAFILSIIATQGVPAPDPNADEGTAAHLFQIWMVVEVFMISFFAATWLPRKPKQTLAVLAVQIAAALLPMSMVFFLEL